MDSNSQDFNITQQMIDDPFQYVDKTAPLKPTAS